MWWSLNSHTLPNFERLWQIQSVANIFTTCSSLRSGYLNISTKTVLPNHVNKAWTMNMATGHTDHKSVISNIRIHSLLFWLISNGMSGICMKNQRSSQCSSRKWKGMGTRSAKGTRIEAPNTMDIVDIHIHATIYRYLTYFYFKRFNSISLVTFCWWHNYFYEHRVWYIEKTMVTMFPLNKK